MSHEFRTPLTLIMGPLAQLQAAPAVDADEGLRTEVDAAYRNAQRLAKLVNTLLDFSRLQAGRVHARFEPVDLPALTAELASIFRSAIERAGLTLTVDTTAPTEPVHVDRDMWEKVVLNLLSNALKFTFEGGITVTVRQEGRNGVLTVADTGTGVPAEELPNLFERFHRVPRVRSRSAEGSGIGLAMVRELVALHGGAVSATSTEGVGTTFTVTVPIGTDHLPADQITSGAGPDASGVSAAAQPFVAEVLRWLPPESPPDAAATTPQTARSTGSAAAQARARVLVADDNADMRDYLRRLLSPRHDVSLVEDGPAALDAALDDPPDLVISDVMMPGLDGTALVAALRADVRTARVPVLLLSARAGQEAAVEGLAAGADDYLVKPFAAAELLARVDGHVRLGRARNDAEREFRTLADATPALVWADGPGENRIFVNRAWSQFVGADAETDLGRRWRARIHPQDRARYEQVRTQRAGRGFEVEYRLRAADGRYRWVLDRGAPVEPSGYVGGCLDIDTRYRERERERVLAAVGAALDRETRLVGRRDALVRTLVAERVADAARLLVVDQQPRVVAVATPDAATDRLVARIEPDWEMVRAVLETGEAVQAVVDENYLATRVPDATQRDLHRRLAMGDVTFVPLITRGRTVGVLAAWRDRSAPEPESDDLALLVEIGRRAATALDNAQLYEREQETNRRMTLLQRATAALSAAATPQQVADVAVAQFRALLGAPAAGLWELQPDSLEAVALRGWTDEADRAWRSLPLTAGLITTEAVTRGSAVWVPDTRSWPGRGQGRAAVAAEYGYRSLAALPLVAGGRTVGVVCVGFPRALKPDRSTRISAVALAHQCAQAFQRASLLAVESAARRTAEEFAAVVSALSGATTPAEVTEVILDHAVGLGAVDAVVVLRSGDQLELLARRGGPAYPDNRLDLLAAHPLAHSVRSGEAVWPDTPTGPGWPPGRLSATGADLPAEVVLPLRLGGSTIGALGMAFTAPPAFGAEERTTALTIVGQCAQSLDRARMHQAEHEVADVLQRSLLPPELPVLERLGSAARYLPGAAGSQTGGDWYDLLPLTDECAALVVGDVVGQGPRAAAVMGQLRSALAGYLLEGHAPAEALELLDAFARRVPGARGSTCACLIVDWGNGELRWTRAGHPPVLLVEATGARLLEDGAGTVLGVTGRPPYTEARTTVAPGASVVLYTDGLVERRGEILDEGLGRLVDAAAGAPGIGVSALVDRLLAASGQDRHTSDDVAIVAARLLPAPLRERVTALPESLGAVRRSVHAWARAAALDADTLDDLQLALGEASANAVEHAYPGGGPGGSPCGTAPEFEYEVRLRPDGGVDAQVRDFGTWRPPPSDRGFRGRGVAIVHRLATTAEVSPGPDGTTVRFTISAKAPGDAPPVPVAAEPAGRSAGARLRDRGTGAGGCLMVEITGEVDLPAADTLRPRLLARIEAAAERIEPAARALMLDLDGITYLASAGLGVLLEVVALARERGVTLGLRTRPGGIAARVLELAGLSTTVEALGAAGTPTRTAGSG
ncbi:MAG: SpoIIE family protein phosphatase [Pseudonocardia sp.]